jgi:CRISPR-associated protein (TIGR03984 family)
MKREIKSIQQIVHDDISPDICDDLENWLVEQALKYDLRWLLAHADDGVIWGTINGDTLHLSSEVFARVSPPLKLETLQQARFFGPKGELLLWRGENGWRARVVKEDEGEGETTEVFDEQYLLWGTHHDDPQGHFALLRQGAEGLLHAPPIQPQTDSAGKLVNTPYLIVRHTLDYDSDGQARIAFSRLVSVQPSE